MITNGNDLRAGFLASYAPKIYLSMRDDLEQIFREEGLSLNFDNSLYPAATINLGPQTVCIEHRDSENDPVNFCHVTALGQFDHKKGGHLILHDFKIAFEFPAGASFLIPSALLRHSNASVQPGEVRQSFTQWTAGGFSQWVACGGRLVNELEAEGGEPLRRYKADVQRRQTERVNLFSTLAELPEDRQMLMKATYPEMTTPDGYAIVRLVPLLISALMDWLQGDVSRAVRRRGLVVAAM